MLMSIFYDYNGDFQWASIAAIVAGFSAFISFIFSLLGYLNTRKTLKQQKLMDQKKIDADLKAKARINWIQTVRSLTSNFITNLSSHIESRNLSWSKIENDKNLFTLNFGPDDIENKQDTSESIFIENDLIVVKEDTKVALLNQASNDLKNNYIVKYINVLYTFYKNPVRIKILSDIEELREIISIIYENGEYEYDWTSNSNEPKLVDIHLNDKQKKDIEELEQKIKKLDGVANNYINDLQFFNEIMRIYFKVEWDRAKKGE